MGEVIKQTGNEILGRWHQKMPRFFYWLVVIACGIGGLAVAINKLVPLTGGVLHEWWVDLYPYIFSTCLGIVFTCKFTVAGGYKRIDPSKMLRTGTAEPDGDAEDADPSDMEPIDNGDI